MNGIWLLLWIIGVFFACGVAFGRWLEQRPKTSKGAKFKLKLDAIFLYPLGSLVFFPILIFNTVTDAVKAGWIPKTDAMSHFLNVADVIMGTTVVVYLTLAIVYIIRYRVGNWQKRSATHSDPL